MQIDDEINQIYYEYFYQKSTNRTFKSFVHYSLVIQKISENAELLNFLESLNKLKKNYDKKDYFIDDIYKFRFMTKFDDKYFDVLNIFLSMLDKFEKKEFFFNGINDSQININLKFLIDVYKQKEYNLKQEEEFNKYNLIEINEHRKLHWQEPCIIDEKYKISFDIQNIENKIYQKLFKLHKLEKFKLSFYPDCLNIRKYIDTSIMIYDEKEYGKKYSIQDVKQINLHENIKFVDYEIENKLYVKLFKNELTFEEIQKEPKSFDGLDVFYTKVVHLMFSNEDNTLYINHIDLEYIFYSLDEYIERFENNNFQQKGSKIKRQKIFKIDNAKINMIDHIYDFIYSSLDNKELIDEYFEILMNNNI